MVEMMTADDCDGALAVDEHHDVEQAADSASDEKEEEEEKKVGDFDYPH